jgi:hypothetical protein
MSGTHARRFAILVSVLFLLIPLLPVVSATGSGLLMDTTTFSVIGDMEEGAGDVNVTVDVISHDVPSVGSINMTLVSADDLINNTLIASENITLNLSSDEISTIQFNFSQLGVGQYTLTLQLYGGVGTPYENHTDEISQFIKRLAPANAILGDFNSWLVNPVNNDTGQLSGNSTFRDGDIGWVEIPVSNSGEVEWNGSVGLSVDGGNIVNQNLSVPGESTRYANFTTPMLLENPSIALLANLSGQFEGSSISVGPPPLARLTIIANVDNSTPALGQSVTWEVNVSNSGEVAWSGVLSCIFSNSGVFEETISVGVNSTESRQFSLAVRPGDLICAVSSQERIHDDSTINFSHSYNMDAAHFSTAGSAGLAIVGTNFHVGDDLHATLIVHNGGDFQGHARLVISDSGGDSQGLSRTFEVGNSLQLEVSHTLLGSAGSRTITWSVVSEDGLVDSNLSGEVEIQVSPSQQLVGSLTSVDWTTSDGLSGEVELELSEGRSRVISLTMGHSSGGDSVTVIQTDILLAPGQRSLSFDLGYPSEADQVWLNLVATDWTSSSTSEMNATRLASEPNVVPSAILGVANPAVPVNGASATIAYTLSNDGIDTIGGGVLVVKITSTNEIIWEGSAPLVEGGDSESGQISIDAWPMGNSVDLQLEWRHGSSQTVAMKSYGSKSPEIADEVEIPWSAIIYGAVAGIVIASVARFVFVWQGEDPEERKELRQKRREAREQARGEARAVSKERANPTAKQEVGCPSCDMTLRVPHDYDGQARCPACTHVFQVNPVEQPAPEPVPVVEKVEQKRVDDDITEVVNESKSVPIKNKPSPSKPKPTRSSSAEHTSSSVGDEIRCPSCGQRLRVPYDRRPITAKCPRCEVKFMAEKE